MPEGDTIYRAAAAVRKAIEGHRVVAFESPRKLALEQAGADLVGQKVARVEARGKYLVVHFEDGRRLETHLKMTGRWRTLAVGRAWPRSGRVVAVIATDGGVAVCSGAPYCELRRRPSALLRRLGPDLLDPGADLEEARERIRRTPDASIAVALMHQANVAGVGNVYKSEILFVENVSPYTPCGELDDPQLRSILSTARRLMTRNRLKPSRGTRRRDGPHALWVYGRFGEPCYTCGTAVDRCHQGDPPRSSYFCPECQPRNPGLSPNAIS